MPSSCGEDPTLLLTFTVCAMCKTAPVYQGRDEDKHRNKWRFPFVLCNRKAVAIVLPRAGLVGVTGSVGLVALSSRVPSQQLSQCWWEMRMGGDENEDGEI